MDMKVASLAARFRGTRIGSAVSRQNSKTQSLSGTARSVTERLSSKTVGRSMKMVPAEQIDHESNEGRQIFYNQVCYLLKQKCK